MWPSIVDGKAGNDKDLANFDIISTWGPSVGVPVEIEVGKVFVFLKAGVGSFRGCGSAWTFKMFKIIKGMLFWNRG